MAIYSGFSHKKMVIFHGKMLVHQRVLNTEKEHHMAPETTWASGLASSNFSRPHGHPRHCARGVPWCSTAGSLCLAGGRVASLKPKDFSSKNGNFTSKNGDWTTRIQGCSNPVYLDLQKMMSKKDPNRKSTRNGEIYREDVLCFGGSLSKSKYMYSKL